MKNDNNNEKSQWWRRTRCEQNQNPTPHHHHHHTTIGPIHWVLVTMTMLNTITVTTKQLVHCPKKNNEYWKNDVGNVTQRNGSRRPKRLDSNRLWNGYGNENFQLRIRNCIPKISCIMSNHQHMLRHGPIYPIFGIRLYHWIIRIGMVGRPVRQY